MISTNDLTLAYRKLTNDQRDASGSWPVICIDEADVLMKWVTGGRGGRLDCTPARFCAGELSGTFALD